MKTRRYLHYWRIPALVRRWLQLDFTIRQRLQSEHGWTPGMITMHQVDLDERDDVKIRIQNIVGFK